MLYNNWKRIKLGNLFKLIENFFYKYDRFKYILILGRLHPVEIFYSMEAEKDYIEAATRTAI